MPDTSPAAFPGGSAATGETYGMTLRQWYAGQILPAVLADLGGASPPDLPSLLLPEESLPSAFPNIVAREAFKYADAMLKEGESQ